MLTLCSFISWIFRDFELGSEIFESFFGSGAMGWGWGWPYSFDLTEFYE